MRELVRQRAHFACEFCGVTETDVGGELTIDHFQPTDEVILIRERNSAKHLGADHAAQRAQSVFALRE